jgi:6-pyruvoyltetrahydropterin/6-carboxytetrahydropterin synthase
MRVTVSRKAHFNAAHRLYRKDWTDVQNELVFGKCNNPNFHGHNYELIVIKELADIIYEEVESQFDHKNLNLDVSEFQDLNPTAENIVVVIWNKIRKRIAAGNDLEVVLYETPRNFVTYSGE